MKKATTLLLLISVVFWSLGPIPFLTNSASAAVTETTQATELVINGQTIKALSDYVPLFGFSLTKDAAETLNAVTLQIEQAGGTLDSSDLAGVYVFADVGGTDDSLDGTDTLLGSQTTVNVGTPTTITTTSAAIPVSATGTYEYFVAVKTSATIASNDAIAFAVPAGTSTYVLSSGTVTATTLTSSNALIADVDAPTATVEMMNASVVQITYSEAMNTDAVLTPSNYTFSGGLSVQSVFNEQGNIYRITVDADITAGTTTLALASNIVDLAGNAISDTSANIITAPTRVKISEFSADAGAANSEFVEIYNASTATVDISNWVLQYDEPTADGWTQIASVPASTTMEVGGFYLFSTAAFDNVSAVDGDRNFTATLDLAGGHLRLYSGSAEIDKVGWGTADSAEGTAMSVHTSGQSKERKAFGGSMVTDMMSGGMDEGMGNSWDSSDNSFDFMTRTTVGPQNSLSAVETQSFNNYQGAAAGGPMIMHMPLSYAATGSPLVLNAQMGDPTTPISEITGEVHYMVGDGSPSNNIATDYTTALGTHLGNGFFEFTIPQATVDGSTANGLYYYMKVSSNSGSGFMSANGNIDMGTYNTVALQEADVAKNPFAVTVENSAGWVKHNITGTVTDGSTGILGATVILEGTSYNTTTAADGTFTLSNVRDGVYNLTVMKSGYYDGSFMNLFLNGANFSVDPIVMVVGTGGGTTGDTTKPMVIWTGPPDGMSGVPSEQADFMIFIGLSEDLDAATFNNTNVYLSTDGSTPISTTVQYDNDPNSRNSMYPPDNYLGIVSPPASGFAANTTYFLILTGNVRDKAGNSLQGNRSSGGHMISFTTGSNFIGGNFNPADSGSWANFGSGAMQPPYVFGMTPGPGVSAAPNTKVNINFSEMMDSSSVNTTNLKLYKVTYSSGSESRTSVSFTVSLDTSQKNAILTPASSLAAGEYEVVVTGALKSANGVFMGDPMTSQNISTTEFWMGRFKVDSTAVADSTVPTVKGSWPADSATGVSTSPGGLTIQFSEGMNSATVNSNTVKLLRGSSAVNGSVNYDPVSQAATFTPSVILATATNYTLKVTTGAQDMVGNALTSDYQAIFTTASSGDSESPEILFANGDEYGLAITFSEPMKSANISDTNNWPSSVLNKANYVIKYGPSATASNGTDIDLTDAQLRYEGMNNTVLIDNLGLTYDNVSGQDLYIDMLATNVNGGGVTDLSGNDLANVTNFQMPIQSSATTQGALGPSTGGDYVGPDMGDMGIMKAGVSPMNAMAGQTSIYFVDIPTTKAIPIGGKIVLTFPTGFDVSGAKKDPNSPINNDINEWNAGTVAFGSAVESSGGASNDGVTINSTARTVTITTAGAATMANDFLHLDIAGIVNSSIPRGYETSGYTVDMKTMNDNGVLLESITGMPFFITDSGSNQISGTITAAGANTGTMTVFLGSPMTGPMETTSSTFSSGSATYSFTGLPDGEYYVSTNPAMTIDSQDYYGNSMPDTIRLASSNATKDITLEAEGSSGTAVTVKLNGDFSTGGTADDVDIFANSPSGFRVKTLASVGTQDGTTNYSLYLPNGDWMIGVGPAMPQGPMAGPPPMPDWMPPMNVNAKVTNGGNPAVREANGTANNGIITFDISAQVSNTIVGTVQDGDGNAIADAEVFAYQPDGGFGGSNTKSGTDGSFTLKIPVLGIYSVGAFKPGLPDAKEKTVDVRSDANYVNGTAVASLTIKMKKSAYTISGKVLNTSGTAVASAPVWAYQPSGMGHADTMTDSTGNYILFVDSGTWRVEGDAPGVGWMQYSTDVVVSSASKSGINLQPDSNTTWQTIAGTVTIDNTAQANMPIRAVSYDANGNYLNREYGSATDSSGQYSISVPGTSSGSDYKYYRVDIWTPDYGEVELSTDGVANSPANVKVNNANVTGADITITALNLNTVTINFSHAADYSNKEAFINVDGASCTGAVCMPTGFHRSMRATDVSTNDYTMKLADGDYMFFVDVPGYGGYIPSDASAAWNGTKNLITVDGTGDTVTFALPDLNSTAAVITISGTISGPSAGQKDAWVWIGNPDSGFHTGQQANASTGAYSLVIPKLASGKYMVGADKPGYISGEPTEDTGTGDATIDFTLTAQSSSISGVIYADANSDNTYDSGEEVSNGWVRAKETTTGSEVHTSVDGSGAFSLGVTDGTWKLFGVADGYQESQYTEAGAIATLTVSTSLTNKNIKLTTNANWTTKSKSKPITPSSGGTVDDTAQDTATGKKTGTGLKVTIPPNALGSSSSSGNVSAATTASVAPTDSMKPFNAEGQSVTATDNSGQPITNLDNYVDMEMVIYKADVEAATAMTDLTKLKTMKIGYWDDTKGEWVNLPTTKKAYHKVSADTDWTMYQGDSTQSGFTKFINDALGSSATLVDGTDYDDYKFVFTASTNHFTVFALGTSPDGLAPAAPTGLAQSSGSGSSVGLSWNAVTTNADASAISDLYGYAVYRSADGSSYSQVNTSAILAGTETFTDSTVSSWTSYYYKITAGDDDDTESGYSSAVQMCSNNTITNGTVAVDCSITCDSGYTQSGNSCVVQGGGVAPWIWNNTSTSSDSTDEEPTDEPADETNEPADELDELGSLLDQVEDKLSSLAEMTSDAVKFVSNKIEEILSAVGKVRNQAQEQEREQITNRIKGARQAGAEVKSAINNFVTYGSPTTLKLGAGERAGVVNSFTAAFGKLPEEEEEWNDVMKIANGRWPGAANATREAWASKVFKQVYLREPNRTNSADDAAVVITAYGLRPVDRNLESEKAAINSFKAIFGYHPSDAEDWDTVRAISYSGATR